MKFNLQGLIMLTAGLQLPLAQAITGTATYAHFAGNSVPSGCAPVNNDADFVAAINTIRYVIAGGCGRQIRVTYSGKSVNARVADACAACANDNILLSPGALSALGASLTSGPVAVNWVFL